MKSLILLVPLLAFSQSAMFQPHSLGPSDEAMGSAGVGLWQVTISLPPGTTRARVDLLMCAPQVRVWRNAQAQAILDRAAFRSKWAVMDRVVETGAAIAAPSLSIAGFANGSKELQIAGIGLGILPTLVKSIKSRAPAPGSFIKADEWLPDVIDHSGTWFIVADKMHAAAPVRFRIDSCQSF